MELRVNHNGYNSRRYSKPWISKVTAWPEGKPPTVEFGSYIGDDNGGYVAISAEAGDIIRHGQKDNRQPKNNTYDWHVVLSDGSLAKIDIKDARDLHKNKELASK